MRTLSFASILTLTMISTGCSDDPATTTTAGAAGMSTTSAGGTTGTGTAGTGGSAGSGGCAAPFLTKGPWVLAVDESHAKVRWEACKEGTPGDIHLVKEGGGGELKAPSIETPITLKQTYVAPLNGNAPPDAAGTYYSHEAALSGLEEGTCYAYSLDADPGRKGRFCTARPSGDEFSFLAIGDTNPGLGHTAGVLAGVLPEKPEFTLHGGDIQYYDSGLETWAFWFPVMQPMLSQGAFFPAIGNHESEKSDELADYALRFFGGAGFDGGETYYRFHTGGVHFFSLNTEESIGQGSAQATWLEANLKEAAAQVGFRFSIVFFHRPLLTCGDTGDDPAALAFLEPIFLETKVELVLAAHMHGYERFELDNGLTFITSAGGGGLMGNIDENDERAYCDKRLAKGTFHGLIFHVGAGTLSGKAIDEMGGVLDTFSKPVP
jgi:acid phosphatase type 7